MTKNLRKMEKSGQLLFFLAALLISLSSEICLADEIDDIRQALLNRDLTQVKSLLKNDPSLARRTDETGASPLHYAVDHRRVWDSDLIGIVEYLLSQGADVNAVTKSGSTPLSIASERAEWFQPEDMFDMEVRKSVITLLITHGAKICDINEAIAAGDVEKAALFIRKNPGLIAHNEDFYTPLHCAAFWGKSEVAQLLIAQGADVNANGPEGTPLHLSSMLGNFGVTEVLIAHGAHVNERDRLGQTPLVNAIKLGSPIYYDPRAGKYQSIDPHLEDHKFDEFLKVIKLIIAAGADVNSKPQRRYIMNLLPLHIASIKGCRETAELLIAAGSKLNIQDDSYGFTPLYCAAINGKREVVELLISKGADVNMKDSSGITPLKSAAGNGYTEIVELLRKHGAVE